MKAAIGALLIGVIGASVSLGQSPGFARTSLPLPSMPSPPPALPPLPSFLNAAPSTVGAQLPGLAAPQPSVPTLPSPTPAGSAVWKPASSEALNAPYAEPFTPPEPPPTIVDGPSLLGNGRDGGPRLWFNADYLFWWVKSAPQAPPLVVTGPSTDNFPGALDQPNTSILYGGNRFGYNPFSGVRINGGIWAGNDHRFGFEAGGFILEQKSNAFAASGGPTGNPFLARPFVNALTGNENAYFVSQNFADPTQTALQTGGIAISSTSRMWGWDLNGLWNFYQGPTVAANLIGGFRSVGLRERLRFGESLRNLDPAGGLSFGGQPVDPTNNVITFDKFDAENSFYGGQLGARLHFEYGRFSVDAAGKAALGVTQQLVNVDGGSFLLNAVGKNAGFLPGGVLAQSTNIGRQFQNRFGVVPEGNLNLNIEITPNLVARIGYTFIWWNSVVRPASVINRNINPNIVPTDAAFGTPGGPASPGFQFHTSSFWAQGINAGFECRY